MSTPDATLPPTRSQPRPAWYRPAIFTATSIRDVADPKDHCTIDSTQSDAPSDKGWIRLAGRTALLAGVVAVGLGAFAVGAVKLAEAVVVTQSLTVQMACDRDPNPPLGVCTSPLNWSTPSLPAKPR